MTDKQTTLEAIRQSDAIFALEGFSPNETVRAIDAAVLAGKVTFRQAANEMRDYVSAHKTVKGFIQSREWATP